MSMFLFLFASGQHDDGGKIEIEASKNQSFSNCSTNTRSFRPLIHLPFPNLKCSFPSGR